MSRLGRSQPVQPAAWHGFVDPGPAAVGTVPPRAVVVPHDPRPRQFYLRPLVPVATSAALGSVTVAPVVTPRGPFVVPLDERRRFLARLAPTITHGPPAFTYSDSGSGTITLSGTGSETHSHTASGAGTVTLSGSGTQSHSHDGSGTGTVTLSGTGTQSHTHTASGTGTVTLSGSGVESFQPPGFTTPTDADRTPFFIVTH